jgi:hypothetical protein
VPPRPDGRFSLAITFPAINGNTVAAAVLVAREVVGIARAARGSRIIRKQRMFFL